MGLSTLRETQIHFACFYTLKEGDSVNWEVATCHVVCLLRSGQAADREQEMWTILIRVLSFQGKAKKSAFHRGH